jgi:hypothetical protein
VSTLADLIIFGAGCFGFLREQAGQEESGAGCPLDQCKTEKGRTWALWISCFYCMNKLEQRLIDAAESCLTMRELSTVQIGPGKFNERVLCSVVSVLVRPTVAVVARTVAGAGSEIPGASRAQIDRVWRELSRKRRRLKFVEFS